MLAIPSQGRHARQQANIVSLWHRGHVKSVARSAIASPWLQIPALKRLCCCAIQWFNGSAMAVAPLMRGRSEPKTFGS